MAFYHNTLSRARKKRKYGMGGRPADATIGEAVVERARVKGGGRKRKLFRDKVVNALVGGSYVKCSILTVKENPANKDYVRRNIITKGALLSVKGPDGKELLVRVTSSPGQDGVLNGIVVQATP
jgi:small subunit ribosomal protein S8e